MTAMTPALARRFRAALLNPDATFFVSRTAISRGDVELRKMLARVAQREPGLRSGGPERLLLVLIPEVLALRAKVERAVPEGT